MCTMYVHLYIYKSETDKSNLLILLLYRTKNIGNLLNWNTAFKSNLNWTVNKEKQTKLTKLISTLEEHLKPLTKNSFLFASVHAINHIFIVSSNATKHIIFKHFNWSQLISKLHKKDTEKFKRTLTQRKRRQWIIIMYIVKIWTADWFQENSSILDWFYCSFFYQSRYEYTQKLCCSVSRLVYRVVNLFTGLVLSLDLSYTIPFTSAAGWSLDGQTLESYLLLSPHVARCYHPCYCNHL